ncbi:hypothetical protein [Halopiger djelfimassiliensis]|uniref:hypothetical protein n=1 Tax=Halopiger djelfimassiliensis TaxID=1293047 RepID=UPI0006782D54|nr:hypothetical protein [Halopiger djelfimassiliensis]
MKATIQSETERVVELAVIDNGGNEHRLVIERDGTQRSHRCNAYSDTPEERTPVEHERYAHASRFGKYYVFRKFGYDTLSPYGSSDRIAYPERIAATALVVGAMSLETFESQFEAVHRQQTAVADNGEYPVEPPAGAPDATCQLIEQDVSLTVDDGRLRPLLDVLIELEALGALRRSMDEQPDRDDRDLFARLDAALGRSPAPEDRRPSERLDRPEFVDGTSSVRVHWQTDGTTRVEYGAGTETDSTPLAARLQLPAPDGPAPSIAAFQRRVVDHLRCQLRDCYVGMGLAPPRDLRVRGPGIASFTAEYERGGIYQRYHDPEAIIDWTRLAPVPRL